MKRRKINSLDKIWNGKKLKRRDFSNLDLEGLDLSVIPEKAWEGCKFHNTSVKNTGIRVSMNSLKGQTQITVYVYFHNETITYQVIEDCDFSDNDLNVFMTKMDTNHTFFKSCNFTNTNVSKNIYGTNNKLDKTFTNWEFVDEPHFEARGILDLHTLKNNPQLNIDEETLLQIIRLYLFDSWSCAEDEILTIEEYLKYDKIGKYFKLYNSLKMYLDTKQIKMLFLHNYIDGVKFKDINFKDINLEILNRLGFYNCEFDSLTLENTINELINIDNRTFNRSNKFGTIITPNVTYSSWQEKSLRKNRMAESPVTFRTNLYLELGRMCNAKCEFCRNSYYCDNKYDLDSIKNTLHNVIPKLDSIVIGGGEPTLLINDLKNLINDSKEQIDINDVGLYLFTNGTHKYIDQELEDYKRDKINYNISRHAVDDDENARIFGIDKKKIMSTLELHEFIKRTDKTTLAATCFAGGLDSEEKIIEYINYAIELGCKSILLSDLMVMEDSLLKNKENYNINIDDGIFDSVINYLMINGFKRSIPIYATGGYVLTMLKKDGINISFKHYISKKELEENWSYAIKRTFDLSIDPNGNLYENWHQTSGLVKTLKN